MYKILLTFAIIFAIFSSYLVVTELIPRPVVEEETLGVQTNDKVSAFEELKQPLFFEPKSIKLGEISNEIVVQNIGLLEGGQLEAPSIWSNAGWYVRSSKPGERGNVIIDGHYDSNTGAPAAFWALKNLKVDDTVILTDALDRIFSYKVVEIAYVDIMDPDRVSVLAGTGDATITLITCGGVWDPIQNTYNKRLVVKGKLDSSSILDSSLELVN